jgi:minor extracellular serine protease Vpr
VLRAQLGQAAGAVAVIMVNNDTGLPPYEGPIPAQSVYPAVTIPFIGVQTSRTEPALLAANGTKQVKIDSAGKLDNPTYKQPCGLQLVGAALRRQRPQA